VLSWRRRISRGTPAQCIEPAPHFGCPEVRHHTAGKFDKGVENLWAFQAKITAECYQVPQVHCFYSNSARGLTGKVTLAAWIPGVSDNKNASLGQWWRRLRSG